MSRSHLHFHLYGLRSPLAAAALAGLAACGGDGQPTTPAGSGLVPGSAMTSGGDYAANDRDGDMASGEPRADDVQAVVGLTHLHGLLRTCTAADGEYIEDFFTLTGTSVGGTATDDRLTGDIELRVHDLFNNTKQVGSQTGTMVIRAHRDRGKGPVKAEGSYGAWGPADIAQGSIVGRTFGKGGTDRLYANMRITYHDPLHIAVKIGGETTDNRLPAGVIRGSCSGPFEVVDVELVPVTAKTAVVRSAGKGRSSRYSRP